MSAVSIQNFISVRISRTVVILRKPPQDDKSECPVYSSAIFLATYTPLAEAWDRECVTPLPSPIT